MRYIISVLLLFLTSCGAFGSVQRYEPTMEEVRAQGNTMLLMLSNGDFNQDGKLNWWEALLVMSAWIDQLREKAEAASDDTSQAP